MSNLATGTEVQPRDEAEWLKWRQDGIGASEAAAALGISPYQSPLELYLRKTGQMPPQEETPAMRRGKRMEPVIAAEYQDATGAHLFAQQKFVRHEERPWQFATLDAIATIYVDDANVYFPVEFKAVGWRNASQWGEGPDEIPEHYLVQVMHQLAVTGAPFAHVAALIGGSEFRLYTIERKPTVIEEITRRERAFWQRVLDRDPPPVTKPDDSDLMKWLHPEPRGFVILGTEGNVAAGEYLCHREHVKEFEEKAKLAKARLLEQMGDAGTAELYDGTRISRRIVEVGEKVITRKPYSFVDVRFKAPKEAR